MENTAKKTWKQMWKDHLQKKYGATAERWDAEWAKETEDNPIDDDKVVFTVCYFQMQEALDSLPDEPQTLVRSAVTSRLESMQKALDDTMSAYA